MCQIVISQSTTVCREKVKGLAGNVLLESDAQFSRKDTEGTKSYIVWFMFTILAQKNYPDVQLTGSIPTDGKENHILASQLSGFWELQVKRYPPTFTGTRQHTFLSLDFQSQRKNNRNIIKQFKSTILLVKKKSSKTNFKKVYTPNKYSWYTQEAKSDEPTFT